MNFIDAKADTAPAARQAAIRKAALYRMVMPTHVCPFGLKALHLLRAQGYEVEDHWLRTREETDAFKAAHEVKTTPQAFIDGQRVGGYDDLRRYFGKLVADPKAISYKPVVAVFGVAAAMALAASYAVSMGGFEPVSTGSMPSMGGTGTAASFADGLLGRAAQWFISFSMCILANLKLQNLETFSSTFLGYDLLARRWVPYAYLYPFAEGLVGLLMTARALPWISVPVAAFIGGVGAVSVFKAVYVDKRDIKCACVGGSSNVPLGFVSLTENVLMVAMAGWMAR